MPESNLPTIGSDEHPLAQVYLKSEHEPEYQIWLTHKQLWVLRGGILEKILLNEVVGLEIQQRRLLFPLIGGGISLAFAGLAILQNSLNPFLLLLFFFSAFFFFYFGVTGQRVLTICMASTHYDVPVKEMETHYEGFMNFTNQVVQHTRGGSEWWLHVPQLPEGWEPGLPLDTPKEGWPWMHYPANGHSPSWGSMFLKVELSKMPGQITPTGSPGNGLTYVGHIPTDSILFIYRATAEEAS